VELKEVLPFNKPSLIFLKQDNLGFPRIFVKLVDMKNDSNSEIQNIKGGHL